MDNHLLKSFLKENYCQFYSSQITFFSNRNLHVMYNYLDRNFNFNLNNINYHLSNLFFINQVALSFF